MERENLDMESIAQSRRKAIAASIETISNERLKAIGEELFPYAGDPIREKFFQFAAENAGCTFHRADASKDIKILYCHDKNQGIWFIPHTGFGPLPAQGLAMLKQIVETGGRI
jgi:hypothetical protein